jgi:molybdopterin converting factor small subunit
MGQLKVLFFGAARQAVNRSEAVVLCEEGIKMDADAVWRRLITEYPPLEPLRSSTRMARNFEYLPDDGLVAAGDEIALIPPVSGG